MFINYIIDGNTKSEKTKFSLLYKLDFLEFLILNCIFFSVYLCYTVCVFVIIK